MSGEELWQLGADRVRCRWEGGLGRALGFVSSLASPLPLPLHVDHYLALQRGPQEQFWGAQRPGCGEEQTASPQVFPSLPRSRRARRLQPRERALVKEPCGEGEQRVLEGQGDL